MNGSNRYDVFVLQLEGQKDWTIQADGVAEDLGSITSWRTVTMKEGDLLYIPKGIFHYAQTADGFDVSTHVTIGLQESSY
jgi:ribosomal protein L16 Arg81 hydroxylase